MKDQSFKETKAQVRRSQSQSENIFTANNILQVYDWNFIHPYIQNFQVSKIVDQYQSGQLNKATVSAFFLKDMYHLNSTLSFVDGYFNRSKYFSPYLYYIEYSLILFFQRDYAASINLIIPSIEGILADYLTNEKQVDLSKDRYRNIRESIRHIKTTLLDEATAQLSSDGNLNAQQLKYLSGLERKYLDNWLDAIEKFFKEILFAHTDTVSANDPLNRHAIFHSLSKSSYHSSGNYIKLFNTLRFLIWVFLQMEGESPLSEIDDSAFLQKRQQYESIINKADQLLIHKHAVLKEYNLHNVLDFESGIGFVKITDGLSIKHKIIFALMKWVENRKNANHLRRRKK